MKLALLQTPVTGDLETNLLTAEAAVSDAAHRGAAFAILPEMFCCPYELTAFPRFAQPAGGEIWSRMAACARKNRIFLAAGSMPECENGRLYNTAFVFSPTGEQLARHRKMHLFDIQVSGGQQFRESAVFSAGDGVTVFSTPFGKIGLCVCFDLRFPELSRLMALGGAELLLVPAAFNMTTGPVHWEPLFRQRAVDNQLYTVGCAPARDVRAPYVSYGNSICCSPWGTMLCRAGARPCTMVQEIDFAEVARVRQELPLLSARRTDVYELREI